MKTCTTWSALLLAAAMLLPSADAGALPLATGLVDGVSAGSPTPELGAVVDVRSPSRDGLRVLAVTPGGAADRAGLQADDLLQGVNGHRLDGPREPAAALSEALRDGSRGLELQVMRNGKALLLAGTATQPRAATSCGYVSDKQGVVPRSESIYRAEITQVDGDSTPLSSTNRHRIGTGKRVLVVRELIPSQWLTNAQNMQISRMKRIESAKAYKVLVLDVAPDTSYRIGARLLRDKLDAQSIRDNAYWEPVVWGTVREECR